jgi:DNA segregation ATPase FtsK/SpoIIIE-like protein
MFLPLAYSLLPGAVSLPRCDARDMSKSRSATARARPDAPSRPARPAERRTPASAQLYFDIAAITLCAIAAVVAITLVQEELTGPLGSWLVRLIRLMIGQGVYLSPVMLVMLAGTLSAEPRRRRPTAVAGWTGLFLVLLGWLHLFAWAAGDLYSSTGARWASLLRPPAEVTRALVNRADGGLVGALLTSLLSPLGVAGSYVVLVAALFSAGLLVTETTLATIGSRVRERSRRAAEFARREPVAPPPPPPPLRRTPVSRGRGRKGLFMDVETATPDVDEDEAPSEALVPLAPAPRRGRVEPPPAPERVEPLPPARDVSDELETQSVADLPRWMPSLRGVMQRARAIRDAATGPLPAADMDGLAKAWPAIETTDDPTEPRLPRPDARGAIEDDEQEAASAPRRLVERATPLGHALGTARPKDEEAEIGARAGRRDAAAEARNLAPMVKEFVRERETIKERLIRERAEEVEGEMPPPPPPPGGRRPLVTRGSQAAATRVIDPDAEYILPSTDLLNPPIKVAGPTSTETHDNIVVLEECLAEFGVKATVVEIADGPTVTRYEIRLGSGILVKKIQTLADNICLSLAAFSVRVEAPIPGKSAIGIEVPKKSTTLVTLRECIETEDFLSHPSKVAFSLGKDVAGVVRFADLLKMPHLLVAGATNSGKSVCLNVLIASMLFRARPDEVKFLFIDPKRVELTLFEGIPHLIHPVIKDVKQAAGILRWALKEMDRRYDLFAQALTRNIDGYNAKVADDEQKRLPFIVIVIDELADLMMQQGPEVEQSICRLAQLARATGIHLVIATQRPSVDVITGLIKANVPSRIAFAVTSQIDSRTILDVKGAENLIGRGDMLFKPVDANKPLRIQGAFLHEDEVARLVAYLRTQGKPEYIAEPVSVDGASTKIVEEEFDDDLLEPAAKFVVSSGQGSTSLVQRKFRIGYTRAARLMEMMEARGIVGAIDGGKPREVLMSRERVDNLFRNAINALYGDVEDEEEYAEYEDEAVEAVPAADDGPLVEEDALLAGDDGGEGAGPPFGE